MSDQPAHDGPEVPLPDPWAPAAGDVVELTAPRHHGLNIKTGQRGTVIDTGDGVALVEMLVPVRKAVPVDRLRQIGGTD